jgi:hypothetical protein
MPRVFHPTLNGVARASILGLAVLVGTAGWLAWNGENSPYVTQQNIPIDQPIPFSHKHHVGGLGIDCRYCHTDVADSSFAGVPATKTCMTCHSQIWTNAPMLEPVRESWRSNTPIQWQRVHNLPNYVYFDHGIHIQKGVGCETCHGRVDEMPLMWQDATLEMRWCMDCHKHPEEHLRPREEVFEMGYQPPAQQEQLGQELMERYRVRSARALTDCGTCHR